MRSIDIEELLLLERQGWDSLCNGTGADFYGQVMTDESAMILAHGLVLDREQVVASLDDAPAWRTYEITDERLFDLGDSSVVLVYRGTAWRESSDPEFLAWMASTYVERGGSWRMVCYQQTPIPADS